MHSPHLAQPSRHRVVPMDIHARIRSSVLEMARMIESDPVAVERWYSTAPIAELDGCTARELVDDGNGARVLSFLSDITRGRRD